MINRDESLVAKMCVSEPDLEWRRRRRHRRNVQRQNCNLISNVVISEWS